MLTLDRTQKPLVLLERRPFEAPFIGGLLFAGLGVVPVTSSAPLTLLRILGFLMLGTASGSLLLRGLPRTRKRPLPPRASSAMGASEQCVGLELAALSLPPTYRAFLVFADGRREMVLERDEPAGVLGDASLLARELAVPLGAGWELGDATLEELLDASLRGVPRWGQDAPIKFDSPPFAGQRNAAWTTLWASAFVAFATVLMSDAARDLVQPSALSLVLPALSATVAFIGALWLLGVRGELVLGPLGVTRRRFWFSIELGAPEVLGLDVVAAAVAFPPQAPDGHLLISSGTALHAFRVRGRTPQVALLRGALSEPATHRAAE